MEKVQKAKVSLHKKTLEVSSGHAVIATVITVIAIVITVTHL